MPAIQTGAQKGLVQWKLDVSSIVIDDDECLLSDDEKQFYQQMAKHSPSRNAGMPSGHQSKFQRWSSVLLVKKQRIVARSSWVGELFLVDHR